MAADNLQAVVITHCNVTALRKFPKAGPVQRRVLSITNDVHLEGCGVA
jgi:hypothetical protein